MPRAFIGAAPNSIEELLEHFHLIHQNTLTPAGDVKRYFSYARGVLPGIMRAQYPSVSLPSVWPQDGQDSSVLLIGFYFYRLFHLDI